MTSKAELRSPAGYLRSKDVAAGETQSLLLEYR